MDRKIFSRAFNFLKKEGFYIILFVCLCVVATVAVITARNNKNQSAELQKSVSLEQKQTKETAQTDEKPSSSYDNALQVKKSEETNSNESEETSKSVSSSVSTSFQKPVEGNIARAYSEDPVYWDSTGTYRPNLGYDIQTELGKPVFAAMDGKVEEVNKATQDGVEVIIDHQNGLKTIYSNLDPNVEVSVGQTLKKGTAIGIVGKSTLRAAYEKYGDHLHFAVLKGNEFVNPAKYIKY
ncbi:peptidoglycan DD-metalloendopeptidase family protein [Clostridium sp. BJN0013]|uniref:peptidoglycan DD-metalloendopeptidase family protein n=1 Tax=Clostridium sp. BJN0013 TaxID=3236840 RepID=UPI0034C60550